MRAETSLNQEDAAKRHWIKVASVQHVSTKNALRFFYIGQTDESIQALSARFASGTIVESFAEAQQLLCNSDGGDQQTDIIFIDVPLYKTELESFCSYLKQSGLLYKTPIIYNERKLDFSNIKILRSLQLI